MMKFFRDSQKDESLVQRVMVGILEGVKHIHGLGIAHRDIKPDNIVMSSHDRNGAIPKLIDFGLSKVFHIEELSSEAYGTLAFVSPEIVLGMKHNKQTDVWSLGVLLFIMLSNTIPFLSKN